MAKEACSSSQACASSKPLTANGKPTDCRQSSQKRTPEAGYLGETMQIRIILKTLAVMALTAVGTSAMAQEVIRLRIASGHPPANTYVNLMQNFFVPEVTKRVAEKTKYKVEFVEGYGGAMVKVADTLEGVQAGIIDIGGYCFCFEPSNLPLHAFQVMLPFGTMDPTVSLKVARAVYDKVPYMSKVFEDKFKQKLIALIADNGYNLGTNFEWNSVADIKGQKIAGAGLNLKWLEFAGATPVQSSLPDAYTSMQTGVYNGWIMFPSGWVNFKLYEVGKFYTEIGFGAITWHGLTINSARWAKLPKEVQDIILEVAKEYEAKTGTVNKENYPKQLADLKSHGVNVRTLPEKVRQDWANSLAVWPAQKAKELDAAGLPGTQVLEIALKAAEDNGHKWPVRYSIK
jgi:TRAP-type C4-dicarboxylate transport system substrate-binding protein